MPDSSPAQPHTRDPSQPCDKEPVSPEPASRSIVGTLREVAAHFCVTVGTISSEWRSNGMPGEPGAWDLDEITTWKLARPRDPERLRQLAAGEPDPLLTGATSPALERYRQARAEREEIGLAVLKGELIPRDRNREFLGRVASILRQAGDILRTISAEAHQVLDEALIDIDSEIEAFFGDGSDQKPSN